MDLLLISNNKIIHHFKRRNWLNDCDQAADIILRKILIYFFVTLRHVRGKYKYKEEVIKKVEHDHPCKLTQTAVKITFPGMKEQLLVSFLGYKEPNLMPVQRCKGLCGSGNALSPVACVPTKLRYNKVKMQIMTQYLGHDAKQRYR